VSPENWKKQIRRNRMGLLEERRCELAQLLDRLPIGSVLKF
jgi:hypothetical protein